MRIESRLVDRREDGVLFFAGPWGEYLPQVGDGVLDVGYGVEEAKAALADFIRWKNTKREFRLVAQGEFEALP